MLWLVLRNSLLVSRTVELVERVERVVNALKLNQHMTNHSSPSRHPPTLPSLPPTLFGECSNGPTAFTSHQA